ADCLRSHDCSPAPRCIACSVGWTAFRFALGKSTGHKCVPAFHRWLFDSPATRLIVARPTLRPIRARVSRERSHARAHGSASIKHGQRTVVGLGFTLAMA